MSENVFQEWQHLLGLPLTKATRLGHVQFFHFGLAQVTNAHGLVLDVGAWTLEVACFWQLVEAGQVEVGYQEVELPRHAQSVADPAFDPLVPGNNQRDRKLQDLVRQPPETRQVQQVAATPDGELAIRLGQRRILTVQPSKGVLEDQPYFWRLFSNTGDQQMLAFGAEGVQRNL